MSAEPSVVNSVRVRGGTIITLREDAIDLWCCRDEEIVDGSLLTYCYGQLSDAEKRQQGRFYYGRHRHQYLISRAMVRCILSLYEHQVSPEQWELSVNAFGKPWISGPAVGPVHFNLSHTTGMIVLAVTKHREVGVDVESTTRDTSCVDIADRFFSPREVEGLRSLSSDERRGRFYDLWTLKEAYIKARGMGLALPLDGFTFQFPAAHAIELTFSPKITDDAPNWKFWLLKPSAEHPVAVAVKGTSAEEQFHICIRDFVPPAGYTVVEWPCVRSSANLRSLS